MKGLIVLAIILAVIAMGLLCATLFTTSGGLVYASIGAGIALVAFIIVLFAYVSRAAK